MYNSNLFISEPFYSVICVQLLVLHSCTHDDDGVRDCAPKNKLIDLILSLINILFISVQSRLHFHFDLDLHLLHAQIAPKCTFGVQCQCLPHVNVCVNRIIWSAGLRPANPFVLP